MATTSDVNKETLRNLAAIRSAHGLVLSTFLSTSRLDDWRQTAPVFLNSEFGSLARDRDLTKEQRRLAEADFQRVLGVIQYDTAPKTQGLAVFANSAENLFERVELPFRLDNDLVLEPSPYIRPLVHAVSLLEPFAVVRVSRDDSSIYVVDQWRLSREDDYYGPYLKSTDRETGEVPIKQYYAAARQESLIEQHFKDVSTALDKLLEQTGIQRGVLCGQHDIVNNFRKTLSMRASQLLGAELPWDAAETVNQLMARARQATETARTRQLENLARTIADSLGAQGRGVAAFDDTMIALHRGQVQTLLLDEDFAPAGWRCSQCDFAGLAHAERCPLCEGTVEPVRDVANEAIRTAILRGTSVDIASSVPALNEMGGVAGLLRYG